jgi:hypothetical protein
MPSFLSNSNHDSSDLLTEAEPGGGTPKEVVPAKELGGTAQTGPSSWVRTAQLEIRCLLVSSHRRINLFVSCLSL